MSRIRAHASSFSLPGSAALRPPETLSPVTLWGSPMRVETSSLALDAQAYGATRGALGTM